MQIKYWKTPSSSGASKLTYKDMAEQAVRGGWPGLLGASTSKNRRGLLGNHHFKHSRNPVRWRARTEGYSTCILP
ncbi:hypothetical protein FYJ86_05460 [Corynebacterium urealyticum]|nr:hypothetical protein FYJ89_06040 [Corynebacterium urealyticum]TYR18899.1 hypothetical protein FYJ88_09185 [Corynebacterium urealyticum]TYT22166.1 hypothetical protein FYJ86_05460 [Corynebacterium urealyticum]